MKCANLKRKIRFVINNDAILKYQCYTNVFENWIVGLLDSMGKTLGFFLVLFKGFRLFMEKQDLLKWTCKHIWAKPKEYRRNLYMLNN